MTIRSKRLTSTALIACAYLASVAVLTWFAARMFVVLKIGTILVELGDGHGIHAGDSIALVVSALLFMRLSLLVDAVRRRVWARGREAGIPTERRESGLNA